jgi:hypothetical protein
MYFRMFLKISWIVVADASAAMLQVYRLYPGPAVPAGRWLSAYQRRYGAGI